METLSTHSLAPERFPISENSLKEIKVAVCDIDYTLIDFGVAHQAGIDAIESVAGKMFAAEIARCFDITLKGHRLKAESEWEGRVDFDELHHETKKLHEGFSGLHGHKAWSRETWIILTAKKLGMKMRGAQAEELRDLYWEAVAENSYQYADVKDFLAEIQKNKTRLVLMTGSDSILQINDDLSVSYDPEFSENYKKRRVDKLALNPAAVIIGDPIDKPDPRYFEKVFEEVAKISGANKGELLVVGDSLRNDLEVPAELGYPTLLVNRD